MRQHTQPRVLPRPSVRVRAKIISQNSRPDFGQIGSRTIERSLSALVALWLVLFLSAPLFFGCRNEEDVREVNLDRTEQIGSGEIGGEETLTMSHLPFYPRPLCYLRLNSLIHYLEEETDLHFRILYPTSVQDHIYQMADGKIDISYLNPYVYVQMARRFPITPFARPASEENEGRLVRGKIVVRSVNTELQGIADLYGKRIIAVNDAAAAGYLYPASLLLDHGLNPMLDRVTIAFASGPHPQLEVLSAVYTGEFDAAFISEDAYEEEAKNIDTTHLRFIGTTHEYPGWVFAAREELDDAILTKVRDAMLRLDPENPVHRGILLSTHLHRIVPAEDRDFAPVRNLEQRLGLAPPRSSQYRHGTSVGRSR